MTQATTTEVSEAMVEAASKAYAEATGYYVEFHRGLRSESSDKIRRGVRAALEAALSTAPSGDGVPGMVLVPREPTDAMLHAAINAIPMDKYIDVGARRSKVTLSTDECATIYRAMLSAASSTGKEAPAHEPGTIRVCPMRDAICPHGISCPFVGDGYHGYPCKDGWSSSRAASRALSQEER